MPRLPAGTCLVFACVLVLPTVIRAEQQWGTVRGQVVWAPDKLPQPTKFKTDEAIQLPACVKGGEIFVDKYVVDPKTKGVRWVAVWLVNSDGGQDLPIHPDLRAVPAAKVVLDQPCVTFEPHVVCLREGQTLSARNSAAFPHNVTIQDADFNELIPPGKEKVLPKLTTEVPPIMVECSFHPWMIAWVGVFKHPYFAVTDENGKFEIKDAPAGKYRIVAWQETVGYVTQGKKKGEPIEIKANDVTEVKFEFTPKP